jgi:WXG100 family type VII secretion target
MSQGSFRVELDVLQQKASYVQDLVPQIQAQLGQLNGEMDVLFGTWKGQSSASFVKLHATWHQDYQRLSQSLDAIGTQLHANHGGYLGADEASTLRS